MIFKVLAEVHFHCLLDFSCKTKLEKDKKMEKRKCKWKRKWKKWYGKIHHENKNKTKQNPDTSTADNDRRQGEIILTFLAYSQFEKYWQYLYYLYFISNIQWKTYIPFIYELKIMKKLKIIGDIIYSVFLVKLKKQNSIFTSSSEDFYIKTGRSFTPCSVLF